MNHLIAYLKTAMLKESSSFTEIGFEQLDVFGNKSRKGQLKIEEDLSPNNWIGKENELANELRKLISYSESVLNFSPSDIKILINAIDNIRVLDPACGSGAFPMGILHKLVHILSKLDKDNNQWRAIQKKKAQVEIDEALNEKDKEIRQQKLIEIDENFENNASDYGRKLYLIENCIYGVDIQSIAVQISKLRFFISLVVDQREKPGSSNRGLKPLPNLETKFVAANTLIGLDRPAALDFRNEKIKQLEDELKDNRHLHFNAKTRRVKAKYQKKDKALREEIASLIKKEFEDYTKAIESELEILEKQLSPSSNQKIAESDRKKFDKAKSDTQKKIEKFEKLFKIQIYY